jgi:DNA-binding NarL/FixJ family response regulator
MDLVSGPYFQYFPPPDVRPILIAGQQWISGGCVIQTNVSEACTISRAPTKARIRIAIADDHPIFRDGLYKLLSLEEDFDVVAQLENGLRVPEVLRQYDPDIFLLDLNMPGLGGLAALQRLQDVSSRTRVILLTASDNQEEFIAALKLGSCGIVLKQTATESLIDSIRRVHAGEICLDSDTTGAVIRRFVANEVVSSPPTIPPPTVLRERERSPLSRREDEIVKFVAQGFKNKEIAEKMFIGEQTVKNHLYNIFDKLDVSDRLELALYFVAGRFHVGTPVPAIG